MIGLKDIKWLNLKVYYFYIEGYYFPDEKGVNLAEIIPQASSEAIDLIESMLRYSSRKRPTATE